MPPGPWRDPRGRGGRRVRPPPPLTRGRISGRRRRTAIGVPWERAAAPPGDTCTARPRGGPRRRRRRRHYPGNPQQPAETRPRGRAADRPPAAPNRLRARAAATTFTLPTSLLGRVHGGDYEGMNGLIRCRGHWGPPPCEGGGGAFNLSAFSRLIDIPERSRLHPGILGIGSPEEKWRW